MSDKAYMRNFGSMGKIQNGNGITATLQAAMGEGGGNVPLIIEPKIIREKPLERKGWHNKACEVLNVNGISTCISTQSNNLLTKIAEPIKIITANKQGYDEAVDGDGVDLAYPKSKTRRGRVGHGVSKTLATGDTMGVIQNYRIRKLTPKECWRLMGFDDSDFEKAEKVNSNTQLYKQAGNSIVVNVLEAILGNLIKEK